MAGLKGRMATLGMVAHPASNVYHSQPILMQMLCPLSWNEALGRAMAKHPHTWHARRCAHAQVSMCKGAQAHVSHAQLALLTFMRRACLCPACTASALRRYSHQFGHGSCQGCGEVRLQPPVPAPTYSCLHGSQPCVCAVALAHWL